ncbi:MAG: Sua5/YciO/YrdC/YwlC family protein [Parcubacteria group bacterium GW2011_GWE2_39_37]|nr:MAG: Sua5/YciO/YrdC/YwlC family protein [Parcubacteria group bacterium GW2011_GWE2_39_37]
MKIIKIQAANDKIIEEVINNLKKGKVIVYPTETFYGLGCDATNSRAVNKIYKIKSKPRDKALLFLVSSVKMAQEYLEINSAAKKLIKEHWPGPLSIIMPVRKEKQKVLEGKTGGTRISPNLIAQTLVKKLGKPIISTSANLSGLPASHTVEEIIKYFTNQKHQPDLILDAGKLKKSKGSTIVDLTELEIKIIREGDVKIKL